MKQHKKFILKVSAAVCVLASVFTACTDKIAFGDSFLDKPSGNSVTEDTVFNNAEYTKQYLNSIYALQYYGLPYNNNCGNSASPWTGKFDQLTDCWVMHWDNNTIYNSYYTGTLDATQNPLLSYSNDNVWQAVRAGWKLIEHLPTVPGLSSEERASMKAQAQCLIAARYFDLFAVYGGLPLVDHSYSGSEGSYNLPRASVDSTVVFMTNLLDSAINSNALRWAYDGNTTETDATNNIGRWTKAGAMALKAKILTFAASPIFNSDEPYYGGSSDAEKQHLVWYGNYDEARWEKALKACQDFFTQLSKNGWYHLTTPSDVGCSDNCDGYRQAYRKGYAAQGSREILHSVRVAGIDAFKAGTYTWHQWLDNPPRQNCLPTVEYVEMFPWSDGQSFNWCVDSTKNKIYGSNGRLFYKVKQNAKIYEKTGTRDPRLYEECIVNGQPKSLDWSKGNSTGDIYELWVGGYDAGYNVVAHDEKTGQNTLIEALTKRYATGFDQNKYYMNQDYLRQYTQWVYLSLDEMYLMYAECFAQTNHTQEAIDQIEVVRKRVGLDKSHDIQYWFNQNLVNVYNYKWKVEHPNAKSSENPYKSVSDLDPNILLQNNKDSLIGEILRERARELGLSNNHYYDMVRYKRGDWMTEQLHGLAIYRMQKNSKNKWVRNYGPYLGNDKSSGEDEPTRFEYAKFKLQNPRHVLWGQNPKSQTVTKWFLWPFPQTEVNKGYGLVQNPGW